MKKGIVITLTLLTVIFLIIGCVSQWTRKFANEETLEEIFGRIENINFEEWYYPHLCVPATVRRELIFPHVSMKEADWYARYEEIRDSFRKKFSSPTFLIKTYGVLKPHIIRGLISRPSLREGLKDMYNDEFLRHLSGDAGGNTSYLKERWLLVKEAESVYPKTITGESGFAEMSPEWNEKIEKLSRFQKSHGVEGYIWGYGEIPLKYGYAFDFGMRRKEEGGENLRQAWALIARDILKSI